MIPFCRWNWNCVKVGLNVGPQGLAMKVEVNRQWVQRRGRQHDLSLTFYHPRRAKIKTVRLYLETAPRMKHLFPSLAAALLSLATEGRGQVFRLPNTSACQKSKRRSKKFFYWNHSGQSPVSQILKFKLNFWTFQGLSTRADLANPITSPGWQQAGTPRWTGRGPGTIAGKFKMNKFFFFNYWILKGVLHGFHQHRDEGWEWLGEARAEGGGRALHLDRGQEVQLQVGGAGHCLMKMIDWLSEQRMWQRGFAARHWERLVLGRHRQEDPLTQVMKLSAFIKMISFIQEMSLLRVEQHRGYWGGAAWQQGAETGRLWRGLHRGPQQLLQGDSSLMSAEPEPW